MLDSSFTTALLELSSLHELELHSHAKQASLVVEWLCDAAEAGAEDVPLLARDAQRAVQQLAATLDEADSEDRRTRRKLELAREAVAELSRALHEVACLMNS